MATKILTYIGILLMFFTLSGCFENENCNDLGQDTIVDNLMKIAPLQTSYNQGDYITVKVDIPSVNNFYGPNPVNIFERTGDLNGKALLGLFHILSDGNAVTIIKGEQAEHPNWFLFPYNSENGTYELELKIQLNRVGTYTFATDNVDVLEFKGDGDCNYYLIGTGFEDPNEDGTLAFSVI